MAYTENMNKYTKATFNEWTYTDGCNTRGIQIWDTEWSYFMNLYYCKKQNCWICTGFADDCQQSATTCKHAQLLHNFSKDKNIHSSKELVRSKCDLCNEVFIPEEDYNKIKAKYPELYNNQNSHKNHEYYSELYLDVLFLNCGHICHKYCYEGICNICDIEN